MQKYQLVFLACCLVHCIRAQDFYESFRFSETLTCPFDPEAQVEWPVDWSVYHTKNNLWDGEVDSAWCISVELVVMGFNRRMYLNAEEIDGERPVFIRYMGFQSNPVALPPDMLYSAETSLSTHNGASFIIGNGYPPLSGTLFSVDIPAEDSISRDARIRFYEFQDSVDWVYSSSCFASEKFVDQYLKEVVFALSIRHSQTKGHLVEFNYFYMAPVYEFDILTQHEISQEWWVDTSYAVPIWALGSWPYYYYYNYLMPYTSPDYPSSAHIGYYDLAPEIQVDTAQTITVIVEKGMTLVPQHFATLRGQLVSPQDSIRHRVELLNNGGTMCLQLIADFIFGDETRYTHKSGSIEMRGDLSCMMFKSGATIEIAEGASLDYGNQGIGFLAMKQGSEMILRDNAKLTIHNTLVIQLSPTWNHTHSTVYLYPGSRLTFSETGNLEAWGSNELRLRVMMLGGELDVSFLSKDERDLIEFVYPSLPILSVENKLILIKDESHHELRLYFNAEQEFAGTVMLSDLAGRILNSQLIEVYPGHFYYSLDLEDLSAGWYVAVVQTPNSWLSASFTHHP
ncbi:MAG TPA: hypothetical protein VI603_03070 [Saprospiraceae bacterium]|nr:hypothetical protein [Saprospiraceae bacterium]